MSIGRRAAMKRFHFRLFFCCFAIGWTSASASISPTDDRPLRVVSLHTVLTEIAREVGGQEAKVTGLLQPGIDPHAFEPSPADLRVILSADVILVSGLHLESYLDRLIAQRGPQTRLIVVGDALPRPLVRTEGNLETGDGPQAAGEREKDPHWWHSIDNVIFATELLRAEFARLRPASAAVFARNANTYKQHLVALKKWVAEEIARLPPKRRQLVTSHDAFGYFARDYGFTVHPISGLSIDSEPDAKHLAKLIDLIRQERIPAIFAESSVNPEFMANLVSETGVHVGGTLYADGLGPGDASTYEGMYRHNVRTIVDALADH